METFYPNSLINTIYINTVNSRKVFYLPVVSTIPPGTLLYIKDICGNAGTSSIILSTTSYYDTIDNKVSFASSFSNINTPSYSVLSTNFASVLLMPDGKTNWSVLQNNNLNPIYGQLGYSTGLYTYFYNLILASSAKPTNYGLGSFTSPLGPGNNGWFYPTYQEYTSTIDFTNYTPPRQPTTSNWGFGAKGYIYSASNTTVQFLTLIDDGMVVYYNNSTVISNWTNRTAPAFAASSAILPLNTGFNPIKITYYTQIETNRALFSWSIPASANKYVSNGVGILYCDESSKYWP